MIYVILVSHGELAGGLKTAVQMMTGKREELLAISLKDEMDSGSYESGFRELTAELRPEDRILLFADIQGGSPLTSAIAVLAEKGLLKNAEVFTGMNMAMVLTAVLMKDAMPMEELCAHIVDESQRSISHFMIEGSWEPEEDEI